MFRKIISGPGVVITSAFIGPGTVTICLLAGVSSGLELLWAVIFSTIATIVIQDMCVRIGYFTRMGLEETVVVRTKSNKPLYVLSTAYIFIAIILGNAAYESGNIAGTSMGLELLNINIKREYLIVFIFLFCTVCILKGSFELIKKILGTLVFLMSIAFIIIALFNFPKLINFLQGSLIPVANKKNMFLIIGLIGTTVVPYNLFLHTSLVSNHKIDIKTLRQDSLFSILLGGIISMAIVIIGSKGRGLDIKNAADMAMVLNQSIGQYSKILLGLGLFAAGLSSALTAPMAAGLVTAGLFKWDKDFNSIKMKSVLMIILIIGFLVAFFQTNNIIVIKIAQVINGILLPIFAVYLLWILNDRVLMKVHKNTIAQNILGGIVVCTTILLAIKSVLNFL